MFLYTITEFAGRPTRDIDFMIRWISNDTENMNQIMEEICTANTGNDFIRIEVLASENITEEKEYHGVKTKFRAYIKNVKIPFSIDVGVDDVIVPGAVKRTVSTRLNGFHPPTIYTYSLESTIAEKFDAIIKRMEATSRMKDFFDIYYLSGYLILRAGNCRRPFLVHLIIEVLFINQIVLIESKVLKTTL